MAALIEEFDRALELQENQKFTEAIEIFLKLYPYKQGLNYLDYNLGLAYYHLEDYENSIEYLTKHMNENAQDGQVVNHIAFILNKQERYEEVLSLCLRAINRWISAEPYRQWALALHKLERIPEAHSILMKSFELSPHSAMAWFYLAQILEDWGYYKKAIKAFQVSMLYDPYNEETNKWMKKLISAWEENPRLLKAYPRIEIPAPQMPANHIAKSSLSKMKGKERMCTSLAEYCTLF